MFQASQLACAAFRGGWQHFFGLGWLPWLLLQHFLRLQWLCSLLWLWVNFSIPIDQFSISEFGCINSLINILSLTHWRLVGRAIYLRHLRYKTKINFIHLYIVQEPLFHSTLFLNQKMISRGKIHSFKWASNLLLG